MDAVQQHDRVAVTIRLAQPEDAFALAALTMQDDRESGAEIDTGFITTYADAWLTDRNRVSFLAAAADGRPLGMITAALVTKLPSSRRPVSRWMHVSALYVSVEARGRGLGRSLLEHLLAWARAHAVERVQLNAVPRARRLYERVGFGAPGEELMVLDIAPRRGLDPSN